MKIVINITEKLYDEIKRQSVPLPHVDVLCESVLNGTPLPKGHGDLIDRGELLKQPMDAANYPSNYVRIAKTIIEADKEI